MSRLASLWLALAVCACNLTTQLHASTTASTSRPPPAPGDARPATGTCDPQHGHCVRAQTWFLAETPVTPGRMSGVTPVFAREGCWLAYADGDYARRGYVHRTEVATPATVKVGDPLIVLQPNDNEPRYPDAEDAAQTTARWRIAVVDALDTAAGTFTIESRPERPISLAAARTIVETREVDRAACNR